MKTQSAKAKGRRCAQEVKDLLLKEFVLLEDADIVVTSSGACGEDLKLSPKARSFFPFAIECKNVEKINIWEALDQANSHVGDTGHLPLLVFKRNRSEHYVALPLTTFIKIKKHSTI